MRALAAGHDELREVVIFGQDHAPLAKRERKPRAIVGSLIELATPGDIMGPIPKLLHDGRGHVLVGEYTQGQAAFSGVRPANSAAYSRAARTPSAVRWG